VLLDTHNQRQFDEGTAVKAMKNRDTHESYTAGELLYGLQTENFDGLL
jgi:hypothetical protein